MSTELLVALYEDRGIATVERAGDRLSLRYEPSWRESGAFPLSLSMPLARAEHAHAVVEPFLSNLLPDNARVLDVWARRFHVSARSPFRLLAHVGEDCAGAVAFARAERVAALRAGEGAVAWLKPGELAARLAALRHDVGAWRLPRDTGHFSLAGAQPKIALLRSEGRWGVPSGAWPTSHILKPPIADLDGHVENEHLCLSLARALGLPAVRSEVLRFGGEVAIVVERFDRFARSSATDDDASAPLRRLHQEDLCQAMGVRPAKKYQSEGGPSPGQVAELLRRHSRAPVEDVETFRDALLFAWLTSGTDAHAKNYAVLHGGGGGVRLAPLYDLASALPYELDQPRLRLAMKLGRTYRLADVFAPDVERMGEELGLGGVQTRERARAMAAALPDAVRGVGDAMLAAGLSHPIIERLVSELTSRSRECLERLAG